MNIFKRNRTLFIVLSWDDPHHHVPISYGPYKSNAIALKVRDQIRGKQRREKQMAQVVPLRSTF